MRKVWATLLSLALSLVIAGCSTSPTPTPTTPPKPANPEVILSTTTSTFDTGLLDVLIPDFERKTGYHVKPLSLGTGQALATGARGEADVLLVHAPGSEEEFMAQGNGINRRLVMHNDFIIVGPPSDPAGLKGGQSAVEAFRKMGEAKAVFISRGDDSGTHKMEKSLWGKVGITPSGSWYQSAGQGMGATLGIASEKGAYTLTDRGTYLALKKTLALDVLVEGDPVLLNIYHVMQVNPQKFPKVNVEGGKAFADYMVSPEAQKMIKSFGVDKYGTPLFFPDAGKSEGELGQ